MRRPSKVVVAAILRYIIRDALEKDAERLAEIYSYYVKETAVSFEYNVPSVEEFINRIKIVTKKYPYLVYEDNGKILGYAYASAYSGCKR